jgi:glucuronoarabinoxylan endo-1,4-beta-xylanase
MKKTYLMVIMVLMLLLSQTAESATVNIDLNTSNQTIRGFGAATPWYLPTATDSEIESAFGTGDGQIGLTILRLTVEPSSSNWSKWVPSAKKAYQMGAKIIASPWYAPSSLTEFRDGETRIQLDKYDEYIDHLNAYITFMQNNDVNIYGLSVQNEPDIGDWTNWSPNEMLTLMRDYAHAITSTNVMAPESYHFDRAYSDPILNDSTACANTDIICGHIYGGGLYSYPLAEEKGKEVWMTEYLMGENNSGNNMYWAIEFAKNISLVMQADMHAYVWWTMVRYYGLIGDGTTASNPQDPNETYPAKGEVTKKGYVMSHFAKFARPGYTRVDATANPSSGVYVTAYKSDSNLVIVAVNQNSSSSDVTFSLSGGSCSSYTKYETASDSNLANMGSVGSTDTLAANSINTYVGTIVDDTTPPTPDPMTWALEPTETGPSSIEMTATTATDTESPPVQYYFECTTDGSKSSDWQTSATYSPSGLSPSTLYSFRVRARDSYTTPNVTEWSSTLSATTEVEPIDVEILDSWGTGTTHAKVDGTDRALVFTVHAEGSTSGTTPSVTSVTYGDQAMTPVVEIVNPSGSTRTYTATFILNDAGITAAGTTTFSVTWGTAATNSAFAHVFLQNVNQSTLTGATASAATSTGSTTTTSALTTSNGDMVIEAASNSSGSGTFTANNDFTKDIELNPTGFDGMDGHKAATGAAETPSVTNTLTGGRQTLVGFVAKAGVPPDLAPAAPTGLTATAGNQMISLNWNDNAEADLDGYNVYRSTTQGSGYGKLNVSLVSTSDYIDNPVTNGIPYYYVVTAVDNNGHESGNSTEATATPDYQTCDDVQAGEDGLESDLDGNCYVDLKDLGVFAQYWLNTNCAAQENCEGADFVPTDGVVNFFDLGTFVQQWLWCNDPEDPACGQ